MPRKKKTEDEVKVPEKKEYGTGWARVNNMLQDKRREDRKNE